MFDFYDEDNMFIFDNEYKRAIGYILDTILTVICIFTFFLEYKFYGRLFLSFLCTFLYALILFLLFARHGLKNKSSFPCYVVYKETVKKFGITRYYVFASFQHYKVVAVRVPKSVYDALNTDCMIPILDFGFFFLTTLPKDIDVKKYCNKKI